MQVSQALTRCITPPGLLLATAGAPAARSEGRCSSHCDVGSAEGASRHSCGKLDNGSEVHCPDGAACWCDACWRAGVVVDVSDGGGSWCGCWAGASTAACAGGRRNERLHRGCCRAWELASGVAGSHCHQLQQQGEGLFQVTVSMAGKQMLHRSPCTMQARHCWRFIILCGLPSMGGR